MGVVGTILDIIVVGFILHLILGSLCFIVEGTDVQNQHLGFGSSSTNVNGTLTSTTSVYELVDNMTLAPETLSFWNSTTCRSLLESIYVKTMNSFENSRGSLSNNSFRKYNQHRKDLVMPFSS